MTEELGRGAIKEYEGQDEVEEENFSEILDQWFYLVEQAPICQGKLRGEFGYQAIMEVAKEILEETYAHSQDVDAPTKNAGVDVDVWSPAGSQLDCPLF